MDANEFWCRAFLAAMGGSYAEHGTWENHGAPAAYCERAADAALAAAQRRGMVAPLRTATMVDVDQRWKLLATGEAFRVRDVADGVATLVKLAPLHAQDHLRRVTYAELLDGHLWELETPSPERPGATLERVEFTAGLEAGFWLIGVHDVGVFRAMPDEEIVTGPSCTTIRIKWGETMPPKPIEVWVERKAGT